MLFQSIFAELVSTGKASVNANLFPLSGGHLVEKSIAMRFPQVSFPSHFLVRPIEEGWSDSAAPSLGQW